MNDEEKVPVKIAEHYLTEEDVKTSEFREYMWNDFNPFNDMFRDLVKRSYPTYFNERLLKTVNGEVWQLIAVRPPSKHAKEGDQSKYLVEVFQY